MFKLINTINTKLGFLNAYISYCTHIVKLNGSSTYPVCYFCPNCNTICAKFTRLTISKSILCNQCNNNIIFTLKILKVFLKLTTLKCISLTDTKMVFIGFPIAFIKYKQLSMNAFDLNYLNRYILSNKIYFIL